MKVAILYICTGKYKIFWEDFYYSSKKYLLKEHMKDYFVFTDADSIAGEKESNICKIYQKNLGWPDNTLQRFDMFNSISNTLEKYDYIFFFNANALFITEIGEEIFPSKEGLLVVQHPGYYNKRPNKFPLEKNPSSLAYISARQAEVYVQGAFNGGSAKDFIQLIQELKKNIDIDRQNGIVAIWHDESHLNKQILLKPFKLLHPGYVYPEGWELPFEKKIIMRDKRRYGGHNSLRGQDKNSTINLLYTRFYYRLKNFYANWRTNY